MMDDSAYEVRPDGGVNFLQETLRVLGKTWSVHILKELHESPGERRGFNELQRRLKDVSSKVLSERLKEMVEYDLLMRKVDKKLAPMRVNYHLTRRGSETYQTVKGLVRCAII
jgi:DNA-binding HxlR family transcriptional regulator